MERKRLPSECLDADGFCSWMGYHYDSEEQADDSDCFWSDQEWMPDFVRPLAPVTLAKAWAPFEMAMELLGPADYLERGRKRSERFSAFGLPFYRCTA